MLRRLLCLLVLVVGTTPAIAEDEAPTTWRINNIPLDMPLEEELNGEFLEGIYQEQIGNRLVSSVLTEWPSYNIHSTLKVTGEVTEADAQPGVENDPKYDQMYLFFSSAADQRRIFYIRSNKPVSGAADADGMAAMIAAIEAQFAKPDRVFTDPELPGNALLVIVDTTIAADEQAKIRAALPDPLQLTQTEFATFWATDLPTRARLLGRDFRGAVVLINGFQGKLQNLQTELLDLKRAQTVFVLP